MRTHQVRQLLFVDTNIYLDFYRVENRLQLNLLGKLVGIAGDVISSAQVEMEFKKNRQEIVRDTYTAMSGSDVVLPIVFSEPKTLTLAKDWKQGIDELKGIVLEALRKPSERDPVYKMFQKLCNRDSELYLDRPKPERFRIRHLARKRFTMGYPPRKNNDTSCGDAINWEWIVCCAEKHHADVNIVSRDSDYGIMVRNEPFINDWLAHEFEERVQNKAKVRLFRSLATALTHMGVPISRKEEDAAKQLVQSVDVLAQGVAAQGQLGNIALVVEPRWPHSFMFTTATQSDREERRRELVEKLLKPPMRRSAD